MAALLFPAFSLLSVDRASVLETPSIYKAFRYFSFTLPGTKSVFYNGVMNEYMTSKHTTMFKIFQGVSLLRG